MPLVVVTGRLWFALKLKNVSSLHLIKILVKRAFRFGLPATSGIILFRLPLFTPSRLTNLVVLVLATRSDWSGLFTVVESDRIRTRPLPGSASTGEESGFI